MPKTIAVDVGGTFTDVLVLDRGTGELWSDKAPTMPDTPTQGVLNAVNGVGIILEEPDAFFHGTTLGLNTLLERKGSKTGLITTRGFRDELEIGRLSWPMYRLHWDRPPALVPRYLRREVRERILADGTIEEPLDEDELRHAIDRLRGEGVESIAVCFLHSYAYPFHELRAGEILAAEYPDLDYTLSHLVTREYREYERSATTVVDAMIRPQMVRYIDDLASSISTAQLTNRRLDSKLFITRCDGGVMSADEVKTASVRTLISGPASGVMGAVALGRHLDIDNIIAIDMGGTSFDASIIIDGAPRINSLTRVGGVPLLMPVIELATIGAGGGSIARIDAGGALEVGPESAGAVPGPACYGRGGTQPTFTDAAVVSRLIDPKKFLSGKMELDVSAAEKALHQYVGDPLGLSVEEAASGVVTLTEANMAATLEEITVGKGHDPREFVLLAYGGGGPLVASALAARLEIPHVIIPVSPATFSAWGMLTLDIVHDFSKTIVGALAGMSVSDILETYQALEREASATLDREGVPEERRATLRSLDMRYENQEHTLSIPISGGSLGDLIIEELRNTFDKHHERAYGYSIGDPVEAVTYRVRAVGFLDKPKPSKTPSGGVRADSAVTGSRSAVHRESGAGLSWSVIDRVLLRAGNRVDGPAIVEEASSTTLVGPADFVEVDEFGNLVLSIGV